MAGKLRVLAFLWLVIACHVAPSTSEVTPDSAATTADPAATTVDPAATTADPAATTVDPAATTADPAATTADPAATTVDPAATTADPAATTVDPAATTADPAATTVDPAGTTVDPAATTADPAGTTVDPAATTPDPAATTPDPSQPGPCGKNPCGQGSTCQERAGDTFVCLCLPGANYNYKTMGCENAKVFPGQLTVSSITFVDALTNKKSPQFKDEATKVTDELAKAYSGTAGYANSTVLEFMKPTSRSGGVIASVEIVFNANSPITTEEFKKTMTENVTCEECEGVLAGGDFKEEDLCATKPCDSTTTVCVSKDGLFTCSCNDNYIKTNFSVRMCIACPSGKQAKDSLECVDCPFGRSGFNCEETWKLALVIVGSVFGALLLIMFILLPVVALKPSKKRSKKSKNADSGDYVSSAPVKKPLVSSNSSFANSQAPAVNGSAFGNAGVPRIPRATPSSGWDSRTNMEMTRQTPTPVGRNPRYDDQDNIHPYAQSRQSSLYSQGRPQSNPYAQNRAQVNPYAQNQSHTNPYYVHDDGRRY